MTLKKYFTFHPRFYLHSAVVQFLVSYILILCIPLCVLLVGYHKAFDVISKDLRQNNLKTLIHSKSFVDSDLNSMNTLAVQISANSDLLDIADRNIKTADPSFILQAKDALNSIFYLVNCRDINLLDSVYAVIYKPEYILFDNSLYREDMFRKYFSARGMNTDTWRKMYLNDTKRRPAFYSTEGSIEFVVPFGETLTGANVGSVVCNISSSALKKQFDFSEEFPEYSMFILDGKNKLMWKNDGLQLWPHHGRLEKLIPASSEGVQFNHNYATIYTSSARNNWKYVLIVPSKRALLPLTRVRLLVFILAIFAAGAGIMLAIHMANKNGKPINEMYNSFISNGDAQEPESRNIANLMMLIEDVKANSGHNELFWPELVEDQLTVCIKSGNNEDVEKLIDIIEKENCNNRSLGDEEFALLHGNMIAVLKELTQNPLLLNEVSEVPQKEQRESFFNKYREICRGLCADLWEKKNRNRRELADKMTSYINEQYADPGMGLTKVADTFGVSEGYVSVVFKEQTGVNFADQVETVRINHACELLKQNSVSVEDIARSVGYYSVQSFRRAFKRVKGTSPREYS